MPLFRCKAEKKNEIKPVDQKASPHPPPVASKTQSEANCHSATFNTLQGDSHSMGSALTVGANIVGEDIEREDIENEEYNYDSDVFEELDTFKEVDPGQESSPRSESVMSREYSNTGSQTDRLENQATENEQTSQDKDEPEDNSLSTQKLNQDKKEAPISIPSEQIDMSLKNTNSTDSQVSYEAIPTAMEDVVDEQDLSHMQGDTHKASSAENTTSITGLEKHNEDLHAEDSSVSIVTGSKVSSLIKHSSHTLSESNHGLDSSFISEDHSEQKEDTQQSSSSSISTNGSQVDKHCT